MCLNSLGYELRKHPLARKQRANRGLCLSRRQPGKRVVGYCRIGKDCDQGVRDRPFDAREWMPDRLVLEDTAAELRRLERPADVKAVGDFDAHRHGEIARRGRIVSRLRAECLELVSRLIKQEPE